MMEMIQDLKELTSNILETMFFLMQETEPIQVVEDYKYAVSIQDPKVEIVLMFCGKTAAMMAENFIGMDEISENDVIDTLKEAINIVAGNFIRSCMNDLQTKINIQFVIKDVGKINLGEYSTALLYYQEEPLNILLKME